jgi:hypothetical protein
MKRIILIICLFLSTLSKAQDSEIFDTTWYLYSTSGLYPWDPSDPIRYADPCEIPLSIYFEQNNTFYGRDKCSEFTGNWNYDSVDGVFYLSNFNNVAVNPCVNECFFDPNTGPGFPLFVFYLEIYSTNQEPLEILVQKISGIRYMNIQSPFWSWLNFGDMPILSSPDIKKRAFSVYPNPTSNVLLFSSNSKIPIKRLTVYSNLGKVILKESDFLSNSLDISTLNSGIYFVEIISNRGKEIHKIVKN